MRKTSSLLLIILVFLFSTFIPLAKVSAAGKFSTTITRDYYVQNDRSVKVTETEKVTNNTSNLYIPSGSKKEFDILAIQTGDSKNTEILQKALDTVVLKANGTTLSYTSTIKDDTATLSAKYPSDLNPGKSITFTFEYTHTGMVEKNGAITDVFLNGFAKTSVFSDTNNTTTYATNIYIPKSFPEENIVLPITAKKTTSGEYNKYSFSQDSLIEHYVWLQFGRTQYYKFKISQEIKASEVLNTGNQNRYQIVIPRSITEAQTDQAIYYTKIDPEPEWVKTDDEGNLLASFKLKSNFKGNITVEGYTRLDKPSERTLSLKKGGFGDLSQINATIMRKDLASAQYWEVDNSEIQKIAGQLKGSETDIYTLVEKTYEFVVNKIDYSDVKRFGLNERQGAAKTLVDGSGVCMEYSDLFLTLMRAEGVPARAAFGYGYDPKLSTGEQEGHQWVEVYAPNLDKWVSVDVTWGENGPALIGGDLNHFYTHVAKVSPNDPPGISTVGFGNLKLSAATYDIQVLESIPSDEQDKLMSSADVLAKYPYTGNNVGQDVFEMASSKADAIYSNIVNGERLSNDQILILISGIAILVGVFTFFVYLTRKGYGLIKR